MRSKSFVILLIITLLILVSAAVYQTYVARVKQLSAPVTPTANEGEQQTTIAVVAQNSSFDPDTFKAELFETLNLAITAQDRDYHFQVPGYPRLDTPLPKGKTTTIKIQSLGVGEYPFTCGPGCTGKIIVEQQKDDESAEED